MLNYCFRATITRHVPPRISSIPVGDHMLGNISNIREVRGVSDTSMKGLLKIVPRARVPPFSLYFSLKGATIMQNSVPQQDPSHQAKTILHWHAICSHRQPLGRRGQADRIHAGRVRLLRDGKKRRWANNLT